MKFWRLAILVAAAALSAVVVRAATRDDIDITASGVGNFKVATINASWTTSAVHTDATDGLMLGVTGQPAQCFGVASHPYVDDPAGTAPAPDAVVQADVNLGTGWAARSVTVRIQRDNDPNQIVYAQVAAWKEKRDATVTKVRLRLGARIKGAGSDYVWWHEDFPAPDETDLDDIVSGKLKLRLIGKVVTASYPGDDNPIEQDKLKPGGDFISGVRIEMQGDSSILDPQPTVETLSAQPPL